MTFLASKDITFHSLFMPLCPTYAFIDRSDGKFNRGMGFKKDFAALISAGWDIDDTLDKYLSSPDENSYDLVRSMGLTDEDDDAAEADIRDKIIHDLADGRIKKGAFTDRFGYGFPTDE